MLAGTTRRILTIVMVVALAAALLLGVAGNAVQAGEGVVDQGQVVGKAAFAYLGGLRTFAAAVLWNRIDPQYHSYYEGEDLGQMTFMLPTIRLIQTLDPQFQEAYYIGAWVVARHGQRDTGIDIARDGLAANPKAGLMHANLITLLLFDAEQRGDKTLHLDEEVRLAEAGLRPDVQWASASDRFESYATFAGTMRRAGRVKLAEAVEAEMQRMRDNGLVPNIERELKEQDRQEGN